MEAAMKLARQYFLEKSQPEPHRVNFIARNLSYHGTTLGALSMGGHVGRRAKFEPMLSKNISHVSRCFSYRDAGADETDESYVARLVEELESEFQRVGPETVCAFVAEPVVGAVSKPPSIARMPRCILTDPPPPRPWAACLRWPATSKPCALYATSTALS